MANEMNDRLVLITGSTGGIGLKTALGLARLGAHIILHGRDPAKLERAVATVKAQTPDAKVDSLAADLSSLKAVRGLAAEVKQRYGRLNVLINNAGAVNMSRDLTADGYERTFATNHLAPFLLTQLLLPELQKGGPARVVNVSSGAHRTADLNFDDLMMSRGMYRPFIQYGRSKLANILFTRELARRLEGKPITTNTLHPGFVASDFLTKGGIWSVLKPIAYLGAIDEEKGARTSIYLASSPDVATVSGHYFYKCKQVKPNRWAMNDASAKRLWELSEQLVGLAGASKAA